MFGLKERGLRFELTASLALLAAAAVGLVGLAVFKYAQRETIALKIEGGLTLAIAIEERLASSPPGTDLNPLINTLARTGFEGIRVINRAGKTIASSKDWSHQRIDISKRPGRGKGQTAVSSWHPALSFE